jgi:hypothetical protein
MGSGGVPSLPTLAPYLQLGCPPFLPEMHSGVHMPMQHHLVIGCPPLTTGNTNRRDVNIINGHLACRFRYFHCIHGGINQCCIGMYVNAWYYISIAIK